MTAHHDQIPRTAPLGDERAWYHGQRGALAGMATVVVLLNVVGWSVLLAVVAPAGYRLGGDAVFGVGVGVTAFLLGARHAFDVDHVAIIDNTTRKLVGERRPSLGTGFWFALGHSSVVFGLALLLSLGMTALVAPVRDENSPLQQSLGTIGTVAASSFLIVIGLMNLSALVGIVHVYRHLRAGTFDEETLEHHLHNRGFLARIFRRAVERVSKPWHLFPVGLLMGLGFDTATQIALLVLAGGTAAYALPWYAILVLPVLFAAGMLLFDTIDGIFMSRAYGWAMFDPARKLAYNFTVTAMSVLVALTIGGVLLLQLLADELHVSALGWIQQVNLDYLGFGLVGAFAVLWGSSVAIFRVLQRRRAEIGA